MTYLNTYLDQLMARKKFKSDSELARFLQVSRQHMSRVRKGGLLSEEKCLIVARELDIDPLEMFAYVSALKAKSDESKNIWMELHRKTKAVKAYVLLNSNNC